MSIRVNSKTLYFVCNDQLMCVLQSVTASTPNHTPCRQQPLTPNLLRFYWLNHSRYHVWGTSPKALRHDQPNKQPSDTRPGASSDSNYIESVGLKIVDRGSLLKPLLIVTFLLIIINMFYYIFTPLNVPLVYQQKKTIIFCILPSWYHGVATR